MATCTLNSLKELAAGHEDLEEFFEEIEPEMFNATEAEVCDAIVAITTQDQTVLTGAPLWQRLRKLFPNSGIPNFHNMMAELDKVIKQQKRQPTAA